MKRTPLKKKSTSETSQKKDYIQKLLRDIVMLRDGKCIFADKARHCGNYVGMGGVVFQADHLVTRSNSATYSDPRLVVCVCKGCHYWKSAGSNRRKAAYDRMVRLILPKDRVALWDRAEIELGRHTAKKMDWDLEIIALEQELNRLKKIH